MGFSYKAMWNYKCPRCRKGDIFVKPLVFTDPLNMPKKCEHCGQSTEPEPGFYYGAMFLSYIFGSWYLLLPTLLLVFYFKWTVGAAMTFTIILSMLSFMKLLRGDRSLWLHMMVKYDPKYAIEEIPAKQYNGVNKEWKPPTKNKN